jgi:hypothetical protein
MCLPYSEGKLKKIVAALGETVLVVTSNPVTGDVCFDAGGFQDDVVHLPDHRVGPGEAGARRQLDDRDKVTDVLIRDEAGRHPRELEARERDQADVDDEDDRGRPDEAAGDLAVAR